MEEKVKEVFNKYPNLYKAILYISENNEGINNPYHNNYHMYDVFTSCVECVENIYNVLDEEELYFAALFHDFNHIGKMDIDDSLNIERAVDGFSKFFHSELKEYPIEFLDSVIYLIKSTVFNGENKKRYSLEAKILIDADLNTLFSYKSLLVTYQGLQKESGVSMEQFIENQKGFFDNLKFNTQYFKNKWKSSYYDRLDDLKMIKKLLK